LRYLFDRGVIDDGWQTYGWSGGLWDSRAAVRQIHNGVKVAGANCDVDEIVGTTYSWLHPTRSPVEVDMRMFLLPSGYVVITDGVTRRHLVEEPDADGRKAVAAVTDSWGVPLTNVTAAMLDGRTESEWMAVTCGVDVTTLTGAAASAHTHALTGATGPAQ
jgi:hypothetical protein